MGKRFDREHAGLRTGCLVPDLSKLRPLAIVRTYFEYMLETEVEPEWERMYLCIYRQPV